MATLPTWAVDLPPHIRLCESQIERLEIIRSHIGEHPEGFRFHIQSHPECRRAFQHWMYERLREAEPAALGELLLVQLLRIRLLAAKVDGLELFGLARYASVDAEEISVDLVHRILSLIRENGWTTVDTLTDAIIAYEDTLPGHIPSHPSAQHAADQVTRILRESMKRRE